MVGPLVNESPLRSIGDLISSRSGSFAFNGSARGSVKGVSEILPIDPTPVTSIIPGQRGIAVTPDGGISAGGGKALNIRRNPQASGGPGSRGQGPQVGSVVDVFA